VKQTRLKTVSGLARALPATTKKKGSVKITARYNVPPVRTTITDADDNDDDDDDNNAIIRVRGDGVCKEFPRDGERAP